MVTQHPFDLTLNGENEFDLEIEEISRAGDLMANCLSTASTASSFSATTGSSSASSYASASSFTTVISCGS